MSDELQGRGTRDAASEAANRESRIGSGVDGATDDGPQALVPRPASPGPVSRRHALKVLGAVPVAAALGSSALAQQATQAGGQQGPRTPHEGPNQPAQGTAQPPKNAPKRKFFTAKEWRTAGVLADDILPRDARSPSATEAGVLEYMDFNLTVPETDDATRVQMRGGLAWMDTESRARFGKPYASLAVAQRHQILDDISFPNGVPKGVPQGGVPPRLQPGAAFFARFRDMTASGFFSSAAGWKDLRYQGNVFNPEWNGCPQPALDKLGVSYAVMDSRVKPE